VRFKDYLTEAKLPRRWKGNVGKSIGGGIYVHRKYEEEAVPEDVLSLSLIHI